MIIHNKNNELELQIAKIDRDELDAVTSLYETVTQHMKNSGLDQWDQYYPTRVVFESDLRSGDMYGIRDEEKCIGAVVVNEEQSMEYAALQWSKTTGKILCIHRLAVHPSYQGRGIGKALLHFAEQHARKHQYAAIRLDAYTRNPAAIALYERAGYTTVGEVYFPFRKHPFTCFEKLFTPMKA